MANLTDIFNGVYQEDVLISLQASLDLYSLCCLKMFHMESKKIKDPVQERLLMAEKITHEATIISLLQIKQQSKG